MTRLMRQDVIAINRQFLVMAREAADSPAGEIITGLSKRTMTSVAKLSLEQIEEIAQRTGVSLLTFRLDDAEFERLIALPENMRTAYSLSLAVTTTRRH